MDNSVDEMIIIDAMGQPCPMPLLMLKRALKKTGAGHFLLKSSDPHSQQDVSRYCQTHQYGCELTQISANEFHYFIEIK
ncbi:sulfurtransferase TusA family protein [Acinetobacter indicus]|uniref:sulfurtransferase TusA family protein n=1 Tax=Acinetobacter indicus TaxID=756892 RepID=UPI0013B080B9|nr:sulfurtransferase TusA family protein [Acinetobacter indicus]MCO8107247.1 sulfurtransferase TusA family protein [Acinetobacter indicus]QIC73784.1 sulfurtransferase TusA family protein [Acinetobacter indicus]